MVKIYGFGGVPPSTKAGELYFCFSILFAISCASEPPVTPAKLRAKTPLAVCDIDVSAINRGDWAALKPWAQSGTSAIELISAWQAAAKSGHPIVVGKFLNMQTVGGTTKKPYKLFSYSLENKDGTVNPHWLQFKVRESDGAAEVVDFWNFGWKSAE